MALLDRANTKRYGSPEITEFNRNKRGARHTVSGHDLLDLEELLIRLRPGGPCVHAWRDASCAGLSGLKKYRHLAGNYGTSGGTSKKEFEDFNGAIVMTTTVFRSQGDLQGQDIHTGLAAWPGVKHVADRAPGNPKIFRLIEKALALGGSEESRKKPLTIGFAHGAVLGLRTKSSMR